jgi:hypothetical protein
MVTSKDCIDKYGKPDINMERAHLTLWDIPEDINKAIPEIPNKVYCNKALVKPLEQAFRNIIERDLACHIHTWDGCFNIRKSRGLSSWSLHSWAIAIDINAAWNGLGKEPQMPKELVKCFTDAGFDWGGTWTRKDGMHFQLAKI